jgi:VanZ family protein
MACLSLVPASTIPSALPAWDKFNHFAGYAVLAWLLLWTIKAWHALSLPLLAGAWIACNGYGLLLEILQGLMTSGRQFEGGDLLANALGALMACVLFRHINERLSSHDR